MIKAHITTPLNKRSLGEAVAIELDTSIEEGQRAVETVLDLIARAVAAGHPVTITNFGTWVPVQRPERAGFNFHTGEHVTVPAKQALIFRQSERLREIVAAADPATATIRKLPKTPAQA